MNINQLKRAVQDAELMYERADKSSFSELAAFMRTFSETYILFQTRERYRVTKGDILPELKTFFDQNHSELELLSRRTLALADAMDREFNTFRAPKSPSLSFFTPTETSKEAPSSSSSRSTIKQTNNNNDFLIEFVLNTYKTKDKNLALRRAAHQGKADDVRLLVSFQADINSQSSNGFTAVDWAFYGNHMEPNGVFDALCTLAADLSTLKPLLEKYMGDGASYPTKDVALARAMKQGNDADIATLVGKYKADMVKAQEILDAETTAPVI